VNRQRERIPYWTIRPDSAFNPLSTYIVPPALKEQYISVDGDYLFPSVRLYGRYDYDLNGSKTQRGQIRASYTVNRDLWVSGDFIHRAPRIAYNSFFSVFELSSVNEIEAGVDYRFLPEFRGFLRGAFVDYSDENSFRTTVGIAHDFFSLTYRGSTGYAGELNSVSIYGAYPFLDRMIVPNAGFSFGAYKLGETSEEDNVLSFAIGAAIRPIQTVSIDLQGQVLNNKVVESDVRFFGKLTFWFAEHVSIFE
jgi:hypothetical protein